jgi:hypothetical protein
MCTLHAYLIYLREGTGDNRTCGSLDIYLAAPCSSIPHFVALANSLSLFYSISLTLSSSIPPSPSCTIQTESPIIHLCNTSFAPRMQSLSRLLTRHIGFFSINRYIYLLTYTWSSSSSRFCLFIYNIFILRIFVILLMPHNTVYFQTGSPCAFDKCTKDDSRQGSFFSTTCDSCIIKY